MPKSDSSHLWWLSLVVTVAGLGLLVLFGGRAASAASPQVQGTRNADVDALLDKSKAFGDYTLDFVQFSKALPTGSTDFQISNDLEAVAAHLNDYSNASSELVLVYTRVFCLDDRARIRPMISESLTSYSSLIDTEVSDMTGALPYIQSPAMAATALRMKDDARSTQDSIRRAAQNNVR